MIEVARRRAAREGYDHSAEFRVLATEDIGALAGREEPARFDGALSNFFLCFLPESGPPVRISLQQRVTANRVFEMPHGGAPERHPHIACKPVPDVS